MAAATKPTPPGLPLVPSLLFYGALGGIAWIWRWAVDGVGPWAPGSPSSGAGIGLFAGLLIGLGVGLLLVVLSRWWTRRTAAGATLAEALAALVRGLPLGAVALLALASGVGEEMLFRGALQPQVGVVAATLLFGAAHYLPRPGLRIWAVFALLAGALFGLLFEWTGSLAAPAAAHVTVNALNLHHLARA